MTYENSLPIFGHLDFVIPSSFVIRYSDLCKHIRGAAGVINNAVRLEQRRNHHDTLCAGVDHALQIVDVNSADAEDRHTYFCVDPPDACKTDRHVIRFCRSREDRAESDIICAFALRGLRLLDAMRRLSDQDVPSC